MTNFHEINNYGSIFLTDLFEPRDNSLVLEVKDSVTSEIKEDLLVGDKIISGLRRVSINQNGVNFKIHFKSYVAYHVMNESFINFNKDEEYEGGKFSKFCKFSKSNYLDFILKETYANEMFPGELKHFGLYCSNHVVHIVSTVEPEIEKK